MKMLKASGIECTRKSLLERGTLKGWRGHDKRSCNQVCQGPVVKKFERAIDRENEDESYSKSERTMKKCMSLMD